MSDRDSINMVPDWTRTEPDHIDCGWCGRPMRYLFAADVHWCRPCWNAVGNEEVWKAEKP